MGAFDVSVITDLLSVVSSVMGLFVNFPINMFLYAGLAMIGFEIFSSAKGAVK